MNKAKRYPGWKSVFTKEDDDQGCASSGVGVQSWLYKLNLKSEVQLPKYYTPLTRKVDQLEQEEHIWNLQVTTTQSPKARKGSCQVSFTLHQHHQDKDITKWPQYPHIRVSLAHRKNNDKPSQDSMKEQQAKQGGLEGSLPSAACDTACTSHSGILGEPFIQKEQSSTKIFALSDEHPTPATNISEIEHKVWEPARTFNMVPALGNQSLLIRGKFAEAWYVLECNEEKINIYDGKTATLTVSEDAVLNGETVSTHQSMADTPLSTGNRPQHVHSPP